MLLHIFACALASIDQGVTCDEVDGGIVQSYATQRSNITSVTVGANDEITTFVMTGVGLWTKYVYDDEDSAFFNEQGVRTGKKLTYNQSAFMRYPGMTQAKIKITNDAGQCCDTVWLHIMTNGLVRVQGYDIQAGVAVSLKQKPKITPNGNSNTGADEDVIDWTVNSVSRQLAPSTALDAAAIEAL